MCGGTFCIGAGFCERWKVRHDGRGKRVPGMGGEADPLAMKDIQTVVVEAR